MLSGKMLETNHFSDGQFQSVLSSFEPRKTFRVTKSTFGSPSRMSHTGKQFNARAALVGDNRLDERDKKEMRKTASQSNGITFN
jgi:hypothetical protein